MIAEAGHFALILALAVAAYQFLVPLIGAAVGHVPAMRSATPAALAQMILLVIAFGA